MKEYDVTVSKGTVTYTIEADSKEEALDIADEWYNERDFEVEEVCKHKSDKHKEDKPKKHKK